MLSIYPKSLKLYQQYINQGLYKSQSLECHYQYCTSLDPNLSLTLKIQIIYSI